jgi:hypothetical protein
MGPKNKRQQDNQQSRSTEGGVPTPGSAEGDVQTVEADLEQKEDQEASDQR